MYAQGALHSNTNTQYSMLDGLFMGTRTLTTTNMVPGQLWRYVVAGNYGTTGTPNLTVAVRYNSTDQDTFVCGLIPATGGSSSYFMITGEIVVGNGIITFGARSSFSILSGASTVYTFEGISGGYGAATGFDIGATWSAPSISNQTQTTYAYLETENKFRKKVT